MSKYDPLWRHIQSNSDGNGEIAFDEVKRILGFDIDHSFLTYKKELRSYGFEIGKISLKNKTIAYKRI